MGTTAKWGGECELRAASLQLRRRIHVYQADGPMREVGEEFEGEPLLLSYHRHQYTLGEHYNAVVARRA